MTPNYLLNPMQIWDLSIGCSEDVSSPTIQVYFLRMAGEKKFKLTTISHMFTVADIGVLFGILASNSSECGRVVLLLSYQLLYHCVHDCN